MSDVDAQVGINGEPIEKNTDTAKCSSCGAEMIFSPEKQQLSCPYCGATKEVNFNKTSSEIALEELFKSRNDEWGNETHVFRCNNCGAKEVLTLTDIAKECPFCGTTNITKVEELSGLKPNGVVPFAIDIKKAVNNVIAWGKKKFFAPRAFKKSIKPENVKGIYTPAFTFDTFTFTSYTGRLGKYYTRTVVRNGKRTTVRELRYFSISGTYSHNFDDVLIQASARLSQRDLDKLSPFETNSSQEYSSEFLHGYTAQSSERNGVECWEDAKIVIGQALRSLILSKYSYDVVDWFSPQTSFSDMTYKYVLLPVYVGHCSWKKKLYNFFVNGKNGKVVGKTPISALKVILLILLGIIVVGGIILAINLTS